MPSTLRPHAARAIFRLRKGAVTPCGAIPPRRRLHNALALTALCLGATAQAQNLLGNGTFDADIGGAWSAYGATAPADGARSWSSDDVDGLATSGSAELAVQRAGAQVGLAQCLPVTAGQTYAYYARIKAAGAQTSEARSMMEVAFYASSDCSGSRLGAEALGAVNALSYAVDTWAGIPGNAAPGTGGSATAPAGAASAQVRVFVEQLSGASAHTTRFDTAVFHDAATTPVSLLRFDVE